MLGKKIGTKIMRRNAKQSGDLLDAGCRNPRPFLGRRLCHFQRQRKLVSRAAGGFDCQEQAGVCWNSGWHIRPCKS
jgi:hypothetical protein